MVHIVGWWCTTQVDGAQHRPNKPRQKVMHDATDQLHRWAKNIRKE